jgi:hypothetical protein
VILYFRVSIKLGLPHRYNRFVRVRDQMVEDEKLENRSGVDKGLVAMFLRMTPEERLQANDNALRAILELRHAFERRGVSER